MSDEERTRLLKPASRPQTTDEATKVIGGTTATTATSPAMPDDEPVTRLASSSPREPAPVESQQQHELVAGWLVIVTGPGRGHSLEIYFGMNSLGRGRNQRIPLDFGDESISREGHAFVVFDDMQQDFYIQHGGKSNLIRLNGKPVLSPMQLSHGDMIDIGATRLMFVPLCSDTFSWSSSND
ncbi:FHA domain-containing protein [Agrobacterium sp. ES01]|uniref:FHA domain-containing protein n=1 Tax=Agrobacterium sp. ES01 TaxID=3420714 RepID=UPI003D0EC33B